MKQLLRFILICGIFFNDINSHFNSIMKFDHDHLISHQTKSINMAICIVGQLRNFELESIFSNVIKYNNDMVNNNVYVVAILDVDVNDKYNNAQSLQNLFTTENIPFYGEFLEPPSITSYKLTNDHHNIFLNYSMPLSTNSCLLYTSPSPRDGLLSRMPSSA